MFTWALKQNKILKPCLILCRNVDILAYFIFIQFPVALKLLYLKLLNHKIATLQDIRPYGLYLIIFLFKQKKLSCQLLEHVFYM